MTPSCTTPGKPTETRANAPCCPACRTMMSTIASGVAGCGVSSRSRSEMGVPDLSSSMVLVPVPPMSTASVAVAPALAGRAALALLFAVAAFVAVAVAAERFRLLVAIVCVGPPEGVSAETGHHNTRFLGEGKTNGAARSARPPAAAPDEGRDDGRELGRLDRLRHVHLVAGGEHAQAVLDARVGRQGDRRHAAAARRGRERAHAVDERVAVFARHPDV